MDEEVEVGRLVSEYMGERIRAEKADFRDWVYGIMGRRNEYLMGIEGYSIFIDATVYGGYVKIANHSGCTFSREFAE